MTTSNQESITITHSYINGTNWFLKMLARCHFDIRTWIESKDPRGDPIRRATSAVSDVLANIGLPIGQCASSGGKGGTSTTGALGRRVFSEEPLASIAELCVPKYKDSFLLLHQQLSVILRVISSTCQVNIELFDHLCKEFSLNLIENFPWARLNHTLHGTVHHSTELMILNGGYGLGALSEEGLESNNKDIRNYLETHSRKTSPVNQLMDVMNRLLERSDPLIAHRVHSDHIMRRCKVCGSHEHTVRSHGRIIVKPKKAYDTCYDDLVYDDLA